MIADLVTLIVDHVHDQPSYLLHSCGQREGLQGRDGECVMCVSTPPGYKAKSRD